MTLGDVGISKVEEGVYAMGGTLTMNKGTTISFMGAHGYGVYVGKYVTRASLNDVTIKGDGSGMGVEVWGGEGTVRLEEVKISEVKMGVVMMGGKSLTLNKVEISKVTTGVAMMGTGNLTISGGVISQLQTGVSVEGKGSLTIDEGTKIEFTNGYGVMVGRGMRASLKGTKITGEGSGYGVYVGGGTVLLEKVTIEGKEKSTGLYMAQGAV
ncbi:right-handed parallel beta-helix repeat-containing protein [Helicobacter pylori]